MKTLLFLSILATMPAFADGSSPSGSYPPRYFHQESPDSGRHRQAPNPAARPQWPKSILQQSQD